MGIIGSAYFVGLLVSMLVLPRIADLYGRKTPIIICQFIQLPTSCYLFVMSSWIELSICMALFGFALGGSIIVCSIYMQEFLPKRYRSIVLGATATIEGLILLFATLYFLYISKNWRYWFYAVVVVQVFVLLGLLWLPESPDFLYAKGKFAESREVILRIAKFNGRDTVTREMICFGGHRPDYHFRGTRDENFMASMYTPGSSNSYNTRNTDHSGRVVSLLFDVNEAEKS